MSELRQRRPVVRKRRRRTRLERETEREAQRLFKIAVLRFDFNTCIGAVRLGFEHTCTGPLQAHHAIPQKVLRDVASRRGLFENEIVDLLWHPDLGFTICEGLHSAQSARVLHAQPFSIPLEWLPARVLDRAEALDLRAELEREHPPLLGGPA